MKKNNAFLRKVLTVVLGGGGYALLFYQLLAKEHIAWSEVSSLAVVTPLNVVLAVLVWVAYIASQGLYLKQVFASWKIPLSNREAVEIWLSTVASGLITFGISGFVIIFYEAKKRLGSLSNAQYSRLVAGYYVGYILAIVIVLLLTLAITPMGAALQILFLSIAILLAILPIIWKQIAWLGPLWALPAVLLNFGLLLVSLLFFNIHLSFMDSLKAYDVTIVLSSISPSSGGVGVVEVGLLKYLQFSGLSSVAAPLVTLAYRLISFWLTALVGYFVALAMGLRDGGEKKTAE